MSLNASLFLYINHFAGKYLFLDYLMIFFASYMILYIPFFLLFLWFFENEKLLSLKIFVICMISFLLANFIHMIYYHPRPFEINYGTHLIYHNNDPSFPSEHASVSFAFSFAFLLFRRYKHFLIFFFAASIISFARVFCGVHFPFDIIGGMLNAFFSTLLFYLFRNKFGIICKQFILFYEQFLNLLIDFSKRLLKIGL